MRPAGLTAAPDARAFQGRTGSDGTAKDGFEAALADVAQGGSDALGSKTEIASGTAALASGQGVAALLAKVLNGMTPNAAPAPADATTPVAKPALLSGLAVDAVAPQTKAKADDDSTATPVASDPLASMSALLPGLVATPAPVSTVSTAMVAQASADTQRLSSRPGATTIAKDADGLSRTEAAAGSEDAADAGVGFALVAASSHLAPAPSAAAPRMPPASGPAGAPVATATSDEPTPDVSATPVGVSSASAPAETTSKDAAATDTVATRPEPGATLPTSAVQAIVGAVTSLADAAPSARETAQSAAAAPAAADPTPVQVAPARSLTLQLTPGDLGSVTVRLHLTAGGLDVHLAVEDRKTLASISHARDALATAIGDGGYRVDSLVIRGPDASSTSTAGSHDSARSQGEAGTGQGFSGGSSGRSGGDAASSRQRASQPSAAARDPGGDRGGDGVFV